MANIFRLVKLARTAYKAAPVVIPVALAVANYAKSKLSKDVSGAGTPVAGRNAAEGSQAPVQKSPRRS